MERRSTAGFTLIELMITIVVLAILVAIAIPSFAGAVDRRRISDATEAVAKQVQQARMSAIETNRRITMVIQGSDDNWCFGLTDDPTCDCAVADSCRIPFSVDANIQPTDYEEVVGRGAQFRGVILDSAPALMSFEPRLGVRDDLGNPTEAIILGSARGLEARIVVNRLGRVATCSPDEISGMAECP